MKTGRYILSLLAAIPILALSAMSVGAANSSPQIRCLAVDSVGDVTVTWVIPVDTSSKTFLSYNIYTSTNVSGPYTNSAIVASINQSSVTINGLSTPAYFYIVTNSTNGSSTPVDTLESIFLNLTNSGFGTAILKWNAIHTPNLPTSTGWYKIYREYPQYVWTLIDSTQTLIDIDTITICKAFLNYRIEIEDASGCNSVSNWAGGNFKNIIAPPSPPMDTVSVSATNGISISWYRSTDNDVIGYVVYENTGTWTIIDTVYGINNTYLYYNGVNPGSASQGFLIAALDSCGNLGVQDNSQYTLFLTEAPDSCLHENYLSWNAYSNLLPGVKKYNVFVSINNGPFVIMGTTNSATTNYLQTGLTKVAGYRYFVQVVDSNNPDITASSNIISYKVSVPPVPRFSYLQTATVVGNASVDVDCYVDSAAQCYSYLLKRASSAAGPYIVVANATSKGSYVHFADPDANPNKQSYCYKVITQNQCGFDVDSSQLGQTIFLTAYGDASGYNTLTWNDYGHWVNGIAQYSLYRNEDGGPFTKVQTVYSNGTGTDIYRDNISGILQGQGIFSYYVIALENASNYPFIDSSTSNIAEAYQDPRVYIPNAFNPSPKGVNQVFIPVGVFEDVSGYDFTVFNRLGQLLFETHSTTEGWNGIYGGRICPEGVYIYHIVYTSSKGEYFDRKGTVTLLK